MKGWFLAILRKDQNKSISRTIKKGKSISHSLCVMSRGGTENGAIAVHKSNQGPNLKQHLPGVLNRLYYYE